MTTHPPRTNKQNASLHLWFELCATTLNDQGIDMRIFFEKINYLNVEWTKTGFKEKVWRHFQEEMIDKESTTKLDTSEPDMICRNIQQAILEATGVQLPPFPDRWSQMNEQP